MDSAIVSAMARVLGSLVGSSAAIAILDYAANGQQA